MSAIPRASAAEIEHRERSMEEARIASGVPQFQTETQGRLDADGPDYRGTWTDHRGRVRYCGRGTGECWHESRQGALTCAMRTWQKPA